MNHLLNQIKLAVYDKCAFKISDLVYELESKEYDACSYKLNEFDIVSRTAKITPKKDGQFVTFWKRNKKNGFTEPFDENDEIDFYVVNVQKEVQQGQFVFPKSILLKKGIISTKNKEGKRAFRVYPSWTNVKSKQAANTQKWQLAYFYQIDKSIDLERVKQLFKN